MELKRKQLETWRTLLAHARTVEGAEMARRAIERLEQELSEGGAL